MTTAGGSVSRPGTTHAAVLAPTTRVLWRSHRAVQLESGLRRVQLEGVDAAVVRRLAGGEVPEPDQLGDDEVLLRLIDEGHLWPGATERRLIDRADLRHVPPSQRLAGELSAMTVRHGPRAAALLHGRGDLRVVLDGSGRIAPHLAAILASAGVGHVAVQSEAAVRLHHVVPGGAVAGDEGRSLTAAAGDAVSRVAPDIVARGLGFGERPDLVVLAHDEPVEDELREDLHARRCAHLLVGVSASHASIGPLVIPGLSSCLRCADLHRQDRDPAWPSIAVQLSTAHRGSTGSAVALATIAAGVAAAQALEFMDGTNPAVLDGVLELHPPDWRIRRRSWPVHPDCGCGPG